MSGIRIIDGPLVRRLLPLEEAVPLMREAMTALSTGRTRQPLRQIIDLDPPNAFGLMPGVCEATFGLKVVSVFPAAPLRGVQTHQGFVALFDPRSGAPVSLTHAGEITAVRTAAASAAATQVLARPDARRLAVFGTGEQAERHARAIPLVRSIEDIRIWGRDGARAKALAARLALDGAPARAVEDPAEAARGACVICTTTSSSEPVLQSSWVSEGAHVNLVGSSRDGPREVDDALLVRGRIFADHREGVLRQGAEVLHALRAGLIEESAVLGEIGEVMAGTLAGRLTSEDVTVYKSLGAVVQDLFSAARVLMKAEAEGAGVLASF